MVGITIARAAVQAIQASDQTGRGDSTRKAWGRISARNAQQRLETSRFKKMKKYLVVIEETGSGYSAYSPDLPGCVATGKTREEVEREMQEAIEFHLEGITRDGERIPEPRTYSHYVEVSAH